MTDLYYKYLLKQVKQFPADKTLTGLPSNANI